jgi:hypothetical protein
MATVIIIAVVGGSFAYFVLNGEDQSADTIKLGVCADIDNFSGKAIWQSAVLAAEQINAR